MGKADQLFTASARKCPTLVRTSQEAHQGPKRAVKCGPWLGAQEEEENTEASKHQHLCFKWLPYMLSSFCHGNSLPVVLPHPSPA